MESDGEGRGGGRKEEGGVGDGSARLPANALLLHPDGSLEVGEATKAASSSEGGSPVGGGDFSTEPPSVANAHRQPPHALSGGSEAGGEPARGGSRAVDRSGRWKWEALHDDGGAGGIDVGVALLLAALVAAVVSCVRRRRKAVAARGGGRGAAAAAAAGGGAGSAGGATGGGVDPTTLGADRPYTGVAMSLSEREQGRAAYIERMRQAQAARIASEKAAAAAAVAAAAAAATDTSAAYRVAAAAVVAAAATAGCDAGAIPAAAVDAAPPPLPAVAAAAATTTTTTATTTAAAAVASTTTAAAARPTAAPLHADTGDAVAPPTPTELARGWRDIAQARLPREPALADGGITVTIRSTEASGTEARLTRRFAAADPVRAVADFVQVSWPLGMAGRHLVTLVPPRTLIADWTAYDLRACTSHATLAAALVTAAAPPAGAAGGGGGDAPPTDALATPLGVLFPDAPAVTLVLRSNRITADLQR